MEGAERDRKAGRGKEREKEEGGKEGDGERMAKGREREEWLRVGNREGKREGSGVGTVTCEAAAP